MEEILTLEKENVIGPINCSPVLPSVLERSGAKRISSPLSVLKDSQQENTTDFPGIEKSPGLSTIAGSPVTNKVPRFLSTPLHHAASDSHRSSSNLWEEIRRLDEEEDWIERTQVVTKEDHILYCEIAKEVVNSIIENLPINSSMEASNNLESPGAVPTENACDEIVSEEKREEKPTDIKTINLDADCLQLSDQPSEKSILEDNDFIHSCSDLDETVKEILQDEEPISPKKFEDIPANDSNLDADETICNDSNIVSDVTDPQTTQVSELENGEDASDVNFDGDQFNTATELENGEDASDVNFDGDQFNAATDPDLEMNFDDSSFRPASGTAFALELDYLENICNSEENDHTSDLSRQSLYVKFDPLVQARNKEKEKQDFSNLARVNPEDILFPGPISGADLLVMDTPPKNPVRSRVPLISQTSSEEQKAGENSETVAPVDQLFEFSPGKESTAPANENSETDDHPKYNGDVAEEESSLVQPLLYSKSDLEKAVAEERNKLMSQWKEESGFHELEIKEQTTKVEKLTFERDRALAEIHEMKTVMSEYEQTMAQMIEDREKEKSEHAKSNSDIVQERDQLQHDLHNTEKSFAHLHARFEKLKTAVDGYRKNEEILKKAVVDLQENVRKSEGKYQVLKKHAEDKLQEANAEVTRLQTANKNEVTVLQAALKRERAKISSLEQNLNQKINENKELTAICDELINKVGPVAQ